MKRTHLQRTVERTICFLTDWLEADWLAYEHDGNWWHREVGELAQVLWFRAHNNRLYFWSLGYD